MAVSEQDLLEDRIQDVRRRDRRFSRNAYYFVLDALDFTMSQLGKDQLTGEDRHVGGRELLHYIQDFAAEQFGPMAPLVFEQWGVRGSEDFGEIVFNLIDAELLSRRPTDSRLDFLDGFDFVSTFAERHRRELDRISGRD
ncbi:MAG: Minf_1886 family protein [Planctomycetota bacterium]